jgi:hypothetical protein
VVQLSKYNRKRIDHEEDSTQVSIYYNVPVKNNANKNNCNDTSDSHCNRDHNQHKPASASVGAMTTPKVMTTAALNNTDQIVQQTLEGHILPLLPTTPSYIHNIHLKLSLFVPECYLELSLPTISGNKGKKTTEIIGRSKVDYTFYPNGTVNVEVRCSNHPFRLHTEDDRSHLLIFFGQLRERLISILMDSHERIVPNVMEWELTECDINKDVKVGDAFHFAGPNIQVKYMDHLFSIYIKPMGKDTVYRVEERKHPNKSPIDFINDVLNPLERFEKMVSEFRKELKQKQ